MANDLTSLRLVFHITHAAPLVSRFGTAIPLTADLTLVTERAAAGLSSMALLVGAMARADNRAGEHRSEAELSPCSRNHLNLSVAPSDRSPHASGTAGGLADRDHVHAVGA